MANYISEVDSYCMLVMAILDQAEDDLKCCIRMYEKHGVEKIYQMFKKPYWGIGSFAEFNWAIDMLKSAGGGCRWEKLIQIINPDDLYFIQTTCERRFKEDECKPRKKRRNARKS